MLAMTPYTLRPEVPEDFQKQFTAYSPLVAHLLYHRGVTAQTVKSFLEPDFETFHDPFLMKDMKKAVERIEKALVNNEKICV